MNITSHSIYTFFLALLAFALCFVPLFNLLGYESAAVFGVVAGIWSTFLGTKGPKLYDLFPTILKNLSGLVLPFFILLFNALFVQNCDLFAGLLFWIFIPCFSVAFGSTISFLINVCFSKKSTKIATRVLVVLFTFLNFALVLAVQPPIIGHQLFLGYFSGSIYDEALSIPTSLVYFRILSVVFFAALLSIISFYRRRTRGRLILLIGLTFFALLGYFYRENFGIDISRETIQKRLGGYAESEHFQIYYPAREPFLTDIKRIVEDHEFHYAEHKTFFKTDPVKLHGKKIKSFIYASRNQKGRLIGGRRTQVAKLWLHEIHIMWRYYGDHMLAHELAHVFTEPFGNGPLRLSAKYGLLGINMGIVEGAATAADWNSPELDPHLASAALRRMKKAPSLDSLLSASGFWTQYSGRVYTLMGSFFRFLIDTYGIEKFKTAYPEGQISAAYGKPLSELVGEWNIFLDGLELSQNDLENAKFRYDRNSIFQKVCARKVADLRVQASELSNRGRTDEAIEIYKKIDAFDPKNLSYKIGFARFLSRVKRDNEALALIEKIGLEKLSRSQKAQIDELIGDLNWRADEIENAKRAYRQCLGRGLSLGRARNIEVKSKTLEKRKNLRDIGFHYLVSNKYNDISLYFPVQWVRENPDDPLARYLLARRLWSGRYWSKAIEEAKEAQGKLNSLRLEDENRRVLLESYFFLGEIEKASAIADILSRSVINHYKIMGLEWKDRIRFKEGNTLKGEIR